MKTQKIGFLKILGLILLCIGAIQGAYHVGTFIACIIQSSWYDLMNDALVIISEFVLCLFLLSTCFIFLKKTYNVPNNYVSLKKWCYYSIAIVVLLEILCAILFGEISNGHAHYYMLLWQGVGCVLLGLICLLIWVLVRSKREIQSAERKCPVWIIVVMAVFLCLAGAYGVYKRFSYDYVDLGLPSCTLWRKCNEEGFYTFDEAMETFGDKLPVYEQWEELKDQCTWTWTGDGYQVEGPNGNSIFLPSEGFRGSDGDVYADDLGGVYWSSTPDSLGHAWKLFFGPSGVFMNYADHSDGYSVRLVR